METESSKPPTTKTSASTATSSTFNSPTLTPPSASTSQSKATSTSQPKSASTSQPKSASTSKSKPKSVPKSRSVTKSVAKNTSKAAPKTASISTSTSTPSSVSASISTSAPQSAMKLKLSPSSSLSTNVSFLSSLPTPLSSDKNDAFQDERLKDLKHLDQFIKSVECLSPAEKFNMACKKMLIVNEDRRSLQEANEILNERWTEMEEEIEKLESENKKAVAARKTLEDLCRKLHNLNKTAAENEKALRQEANNHQNMTLVFQKQLEELQMMMKSNYALSTQLRADNESLARKYSALSVNYGASLKEIVSLTNTLKHEKYLLSSTIAEYDTFVKNQSQLWEKRMEQKDEEIDILNQVKGDQENRMEQLEIIIMDQKSKWEADSNNWKAERECLLDKIHEIGEECTNLQEKIKALEKNLAERDETLVKLLDKEKQCDLLQNQVENLQEINSSQNTNFLKIQHHFNETKSLLKDYDHETIRLNNIAQKLKEELSLLQDDCDHFKSSPADAQGLEKIVLYNEKKVETLTVLCKTLQRERAGYLKQLQEANICPAQINTFVSISELDSTTSTSIIDNTSTSSTPIPDTPTPDSPIPDTQSPYTPTPFTPTPYTPTSETPTSDTPRSCTPTFSPPTCSTPIPISPASSSSILFSLKYNTPTTISTSNTLTVSTLTTSTTTPTTSTSTTTPTTSTIHQRLLTKSDIVDSKSNQTKVTISVSPANQVQHSKRQPRDRKFSSLHRPQRRLTRKERIKRDAELKVKEAARFEKTSIVFNSNITDQVPEISTYDIQNIINTLKVESEKIISINNDIKPNDKTTVAKTSPLTVIQLQKALQSEKSTDENTIANPENESYIAAIDSMANTTTTLISNIQNLLRQEARELINEMEIDKESQEDLMGIHKLIAKLESESGVLKAVRNAHLIETVDTQIQTQIPRELSNVITEEVNHHEDEADNCNTEEKLFNNIKRLLEKEAEILAPDSNNEIFSISVNILAKQIYLESLEEIEQNDMSEDLSNFDDTIIFSDLSEELSKISPFLDHTIQVKLSDDLHIDESVLVKSTEQIAQQEQVAEQLLNLDDSIQVELTDEIYSNEIDQVKLTETTVQQEQVTELPDIDDSIQEQIDSTDNLIEELQMNTCENKVSKLDEQTLQLDMINTEESLPFHDQLQKDPTRIDISSKIKQLEPEENSIISTLEPVRVQQPESSSQNNQSKRQLKKMMKKAIKKDKSRASKAKSETKSLLQDPPLYKSTLNVEDYGATKRRRLYADDQSTTNHSVKFNKAAQLETSEHTLKSNHNNCLNNDTTNQKVKEKLKPKKRVQSKKQNSNPVKNDCSDQKIKEDPKTSKKKQMKPKSNSRNQKSTKENMPPKQLKADSKQIEKQESRITHKELKRISKKSTHVDTAIPAKKLSTQSSVNAPKPTKNSTNVPKSSWNSPRSLKLNLKSRCGDSSKSSTFQYVPTSNHTSRSQTQSYVPTSISSSRQLQSSSNVRPMKSFLPSLILPQRAPVNTTSNSKTAKTSQSSISVSTSVTATTTFVRGGSVQPTMTISKSLSTVSTSVIMTSSKLNLINALSPSINAVSVSQSTSIVVTVQSSQPTLRSSTSESLPITQTNVTLSVTSVQTSRQVYMNQPPRYSWANSHGRSKSQSTYGQTPIVTSIPLPINRSQPTLYMQQHLCSPAQMLVQMNINQTPTLSLNPFPGSQSPTHMSSMYSMQQPISNNEMESSNSSFFSEPYNAPQMHIPQQTRTISQPFSMPVVQSQTSSTTSEVVDYFGFARPTPSTSRISENCLLPTNLRTDWNNPVTTPVQSNNETEGGLDLIDRIDMEQSAVITFQEMFGDNLNPNDELLGNESDIIQLQKQIFQSLARDLFPMSKSRKE